MFGLFDKKKEAEVSLADRIAAKPLAAAGAPQGATAAKPRVRSRDSAVSAQAI